MKGKVLGSALFFLMLSNAFASYFVRDLSYNVVGSTIEIKWVLPKNFTNAFLYYNVYFSSVPPRYTNGYLENFLDFNLAGVIGYSTNEFASFVFTNHQSNYHYMVLPVSNGFFLFEELFSFVVSNVGNTNQSNLVSTDQVVPNVSKNYYEFPDLSEEGFEVELKSILRDYFFKGKYKDALEKLISLRDEVVDENDRSLIDIYIARCYYSLGNKRKAILILLRIKNQDIREIAEFWLNRFSKYF